MDERVPGLGVAPRPGPQREVTKRRPLLRFLSPRASVECKVKSPAYEVRAPLRAVRRAILQNRPVRVIALGSSSTVGVGASSPRATYPIRLENDLEGVIFPDMPWVISPDAASTQLRNALSRHWPVRARGRGRLYAFGFDACRIVPLLKAGQFGSAHAIPGMTGLLSIDENGQVRRELDWAKVSGGRAVPLGTVATAATN